MAAPTAGRFTAIVLGIALVLVIVSFSNGIGGKFVYDDQKQIAQNQLIQESRYLGKALTSDVWAFTGDEGKARSNYWRPVFVGWLALQFHLFGTATTLWHIANIALQALATVLGYFVLTSVGAKPDAAAIGTWIFAAHPAHVESITWISGSPDPLVASFLFGAYLCRLAARRGGSLTASVGGPVLFALALLCKEIAIVFPAIVFLTELVWPDERESDPARRARGGVRAAVPYVAVALIYLAVRVGVIGMTQMVPSRDLGLAEVILSAPQVLAFYLWHAFLPYGLGPSYALRAVTPSNLSLANFMLPALFIAALGFGAYVLARRGGIYRLGLVWFFLPLAPVFDLRSFIPEDFVHDRYLYLPLFGIAMIAGSAAADLWTRARGPARAGGMSAAWALGIPIALVLMLLTRSYNTAWLDEISLWTRAVRSNPDSAFTHAQLGEAFRKANRLVEARAELERALKLNPAVTNAHVVLGAIAVRENRLDEAIVHLELVVKEYPTHGPALEQLALAYQKQGKLDRAIEVSDRLRRAMPLRHALYTVNIAVLHRMQDRRDEALADLLSIKDELQRETDHNALRGWWYLGELYRESGQREQAMDAYGRYLQATVGRTEPEVVELRKLAAAAAEHPAPDATLVDPGRR